MIAEEHAEHGPLLRFPHLPSELEGCRRRECDEGGRLPFAGRGRQHVRLCDEETQPRRSNSPNVAPLRRGVVVLASS